MSKIYRMQKDNDIQEISENDLNLFLDLGFVILEEISPTIADVALDCLDIVDATSNLFDF